MDTKLSTELQKQILDCTEHIRSFKQRILQLEISQNTKILQQAVLHQAEDLSKKGEELTSLAQTMDVLVVEVVNTQATTIAHEEVLVELHAATFIPAASLLGDMLNAGGDTA